MEREREREREKSILSKHKIDSPHSSGSTLDSTNPINSFSIIYIVHIDRNQS